jgi:hypothetical protein
MVMVVQSGRAKVVSWEDLLTSDIVINGMTAQTRVTYAVVRKGERDSIRRPSAFAGIQVLYGPTPYQPGVHSIVDAKIGAPIVTVRFCAKGVWLRKKVYPAALLGLVAPERVSADDAIFACLLPINLGKLQYE